MRTRCHGEPPAPARRSMKPNSGRPARSTPYVSRRKALSSPKNSASSLASDGAADRGEQRDVVRGLALGRRRVDPLAETHRDEARAQHVLCRLAQPEVDAERERGDQLGEPKLRLRHTLHA